MDEPPANDVGRALEAALRYFAEAAPKHTADEENSLFPRMRQIDTPEVRSAFAELDELEHDHREAESLHAEADRLGKQYLATGTLAAADVQRFRQAVASLLKIYERHIRVEDEEIFPLAARILPEHEKSAIAREMANRRNVKIGSCP
jgi:hemerythrin-like domain-containing protein